FFFQAEDGIRDFHVTGVQTCALPISEICWPIAALMKPGTAERGSMPCAAAIAPKAIGSAIGPSIALVSQSGIATGHAEAATIKEIGRASCRERVELAVGVGLVKEDRQ